MSTAMESSLLIEDITEPEYRIIRELIERQTTGFDYFYFSKDCLNAEQNSYAGAFGGEVDQWPEIEKAVYVTWKYLKRYVRIDFNVKYPETAYDTGKEYDEEIYEEFMSEDFDKFTTDPKDLEIKDTWRIDLDSEDNVLTRRIYIQNYMAWCINGERFPFTINIQEDVTPDAGWEKRLISIDVSKLPDELKEPTIRKYGPGAKEIIK